MNRSREGNVGCQAALRTYLKSTVHEVKGGITGITVFLHLYRTVGEDRE